MSEEDDISINKLLQNNSVLQDNQQMIQIAESIFEYTQFLLDDDKNLTKTGNLNSGANKLLETRIIELILPEEIKREDTDD